MTTLAAIDQSAELNKLLNEADLEVTIPTGVYEIDAPIVVPRGLRGITANSVTLKPTKEFAGEALVIASGSPGDRLDECKITGLKTDCQNKPTIGLLSNHTRRLYLDDCWFYKSASSGLVLLNGWDFHCQRCVIWACGDDTAPAMVLSGDVGHEGQATGTVANCSIEKFPRIGLTCTNQKWLRITDMKFLGVHHHRSRSALGVQFSNCDGVRMRDTMFTLVREKWWKSDDCYDVIVEEDIDRTKVRK